MERTWTDESGRSWNVRVAGKTTIFSAGGRRHVATTDRAGDLESMDDDEMRKLFEAAREERDAAGDGESSPSAIGRESAPHVDPARHGSTEQE